MTFLSWVGLMTLCLTACLALTSAQVAAQWFLPVPPVLLADLVVVSAVSISLAVYSPRLLLVIPASAAGPIVVGSLGGPLRVLGLGVVVVCAICARPSPEAHSTGVSFEAH
jgi:hypothetical protein